MKKYKSRSSKWETFFYDFFSGRKKTNLNLKIEL